LYLHFDEDPDAGALGVGRLMRHFMGASQDTDELVAEFPENPRLYVTPELTHDGRYLVLHISEGTSEKNRLWVCPVSTDSGAATIGQPLRVVDEAYAGFRLVRGDPTGRYLLTDPEAPLRPGGPARPGNVRDARRGAGARAPARAPAGGGRPPGGRGGDHARAGSHGTAAATAGCWWRRPAVVQEAADLLAFAAEHTGLR